MRTSARPDAAKAYASWRAPCTGTGPTAASSPSRVAAICKFMPGYPVLAENRSGTWRQSQVGHTVPSTSLIFNLAAGGAGSFVHGPACWRDMARPPLDPLRVPLTELEDKSGGRDAECDASSGCGTG